MPNLAKYITILFLLLCSLPSKAQRTIEWYEPDFDSAYFYHELLYSGRIDVPHIYQFFSPASAKSGITSVVIQVTKRVSFVATEGAKGYDAQMVGRSPAYTQGQNIEYSPDGFIDRTVRYSEYNGKVDTFEVNEYSRTLQSGRLSVKVQCRQVNNWTEKVYFFNRWRRIDSTWTVDDSNVSRNYYTYDDHERVVRITRSPSAHISRGDTVALKHYTEIDLNHVFYNLLRSSDVQQLVRDKDLSSRHSELKKGFLVNATASDQAVTLLEVAQMGNVIVCGTTFRGTSQEYFSGTRIARFNGEQPDLFIELFRSNRTFHTTIREKDSNRWKVTNQSSMFGRLVTGVELRQNWPIKVNNDDGTEIKYYYYR